MSDRRLSTVTPQHPNTLIDVPDASLVATCQKVGLQANEQSSQKAFRELIRRYNGLVYHFAFNMTHQSELSEEITQDTFLKVHQNIHRFDNKRVFKPWLMRIASNTAISALRKEQNKTTVSIDVLSEQGFQLSDMEQMSTSNPSQAAEASPMEKQEEQTETQEKIQNALAQLDEKYRQVLILRYMQEFSYEDISQSLGIPLNTVRTWLRRGLDQFKKIMVNQQVTQQANPA
jgi:RNA polymerase sigma-70 factor (ECF subfamily)